MSHVSFGGETAGSVSDLFSINDAWARALLRTRTHTGRGSSAITSRQRVDVCCTRGTTARCPAGMWTAPAVFEISREGFHAGIKWTTGGGGIKKWLFTTLAFGAVNFPLCPG